MRLSLATLFEFSWGLATHTVPFSPWKLNSELVSSFTILEVSSRVLDLRHAGKQTNKLCDRLVSGVMLSYLALKGRKIHCSLEMILSFNSANWSGHSLCPCYILSSWHCHGIWHLTWDPYRYAERTAKPCWAEPHQATFSSNEGKDSRQKCKWTLHALHVRNSVNVCECIIEQGSRPSIAIEIIQCLLQHGKARSLHSNYFESMFIPWGKAST